MQMVCFRGLLRFLAGLRLNLIWPAGLCRPAGRVCSWGGLTVTIRGRIDIRRLKHIYILLRVQSLRMHVIHMLFVTIIAAGLIANERRSVVFSQKIRLKVPVCAAFSVIELA